MNKTAAFSILIIFIFLSCYNNNKNIPSAKKGVLDLRNWNFEKDGNMNLNGEWEFYWNEFLEPSDFKKDIKPAMTGFINVPKKWKNFKINNKKINASGYATYHLLIKVKNEDILLGLNIQTIFTSYKLWINDKLLITNGIAGKDRNEEKPKDLRRVAFFTAGSNEINLIIQASNFFNRSGGINYPILLGEADKIHKDNIKKINLNVFIFGTIIIFAFFYLTLFILRKNDYSSLFFSIFCFIIAVRGLFLGECVFFYYFPDFPYELQKKIEYFTLSFSLPFFSLYLYSLYPKELSKKNLCFFMLPGMIYSLIISIYPLRIYSFLLPYFELVVILLSLNIFIILIYAAIKKKESSIIFIIGFIIFFIFIIIDILQERLKIGFGYYTPYGTLAFIYIQSLILSKKFSRAFSRVENYSIELEEEVCKRTRQLEMVNEEKTRFFINIAHETKTPLTLINNYLNKYIKKRNLSYEKEIKIIKDNLDKLTKDMVDFLDIEKLDKGKIIYNHNQIINLTDMLKNKIIMFHEYAINKNIKINLNLENNIYAKIDPYAVDRIINNLLDNAIKYTNDNGNINITLKHIEDKTHIIIEDNGIGMSADQLKNIFDPFYQASHDKKNIQGIGIGLSIVKRVVNSINGKILVESKLNEGTKFIIIIDKYILKDEDIINKDIDYSIPIGYTGNVKLRDENNNKLKYNLLIVEDNVELLSYLIDTMKDKYNVFYAVNGQEALNKLDKIPKPDLIISDIMMDIIDGYEFYDKLSEKEEYNDVPFIFLTAKTSMNEKLKGLSKGAIDYLLKPFDIDVLVTKIDSILKKNKIIKKIKTREVIKKIREKIDEDKLINFENKCKKFNISDKEKDILKLLFKGKINKEISYELNTTFHIVRNHIKNIYKKCNVQNKVELLNIFEIQY